MEGVLQYAGYIDGKFVEGEGETIVVENPSDESIVAEFKGVSPAQVEAAIRAARTAFDQSDWSRMPTADRAAILRRYAKALAARADKLRELAMAEAGCPISSSVMAAQVTTPLKHANDIIDLFLTLPEHEENPVPLSERVTPQGQLVQSLRYYSPIGVVAGIAANNVPFYTALWKVMPALVAGNTIVLRPNPLTPLSAMVFAEAADEVGLPAGVLNVVLENGLEGAQLLTTDPAVDLVAFTGSSTVGVAVMQQAATTMKRLQLELGGKSAQIFLPDSVERVPMYAASIAVSHAGQGCSLGTRVFVPEENKAEVLASVAKVMESYRIGPANDPQTQAGPVISRSQVERCERYVRLATENGATVVTGGKRPESMEKGFFFEPTLLDVPDNSNPAAQDEIFGPVVSVIGYKDLDHAIAMANDSKFGLSGYVHGLDKAKALKVALGIRSGTVNVNGGLTSAYASSGGQRMSGLARERGVEGLRAFQQLSTINVA